MTIDGFAPGAENAFVSFDPEVADRWHSAVGWVADRFGIEVDGLEQLPAGGALLVGNHAFGWDPMFVLAEVWRRRRRRVWVLGEHLWWRFPFVRRLAAAVGTVDGTQDNAERLLSSGELVLVLPGGLREAVKPRELRYRLLWGRRYGFVRAALRSGVPIVPIASIGTDELFDFVGDAYRRGERWLGSRRIPIPRPVGWLPIPRRAHVRFVVGAPIATHASPEDAGDPRTLERVRHEVAGALHELIDVELARRAGLDLGASPSSPSEAR